MSISSEIQAISGEEDPSAPAPGRWNLVGDLLIWGIVVLIARLPTFFFRELDGDESVYLVVANQMRHGARLYVDTWDIKPPGIFLLLWAFLPFFRDPALMIRILGWIAVVVSCAGIGRIARAFSNGSRWVPFVASGLFALSSVVWGGDSSNTEVFFTPCVVWAMYGAILAVRKPVASPGRMFLRFLGPGLLLGLGMLFKSVVVLDVAVLVILLSLWMWRRGRETSEPMVGPAMGALAAIGLGCALPTLAIMAEYMAQGLMGPYIEANFTVPRAYGRVNFSAVLLGRLLFKLFNQNPFPVTLALIAPWFLVTRVPKGRSATNWGLACALFWLGFTALAVIASSKYFPHYYFQMMAPLCLVAALVFGRIEADLPARSGTRVVLAAIWLTVPLVTTTASFWIRAARPIWAHRHALQLVDAHESDPITEYMRTRLEPDDQIYVVEGYLPVYYLLDRPPLTRYVFQAFLTHTWFSRVAKIDNRAELASIFEKRPRYVLVRQAQWDGVIPVQAYWEERDPAFLEDLKERLGQGYELETVVNGCRIYRRTS